MKLKDYQEFTETTNITWEAIKGFLESGDAEHQKMLMLMYLSLGLAGEAAEIANKVKKILRDSAGEINTTNSKALSKELGDVAWYMSEIANLIGVDLDEILEENFQKLTSRKERAVLGGSGDDR